MGDYEPLDLSTFRNAGVDFYTPHVPRTGSQTYHGLPFDIGDPDDGASAYQTFIGFDAAELSAPVKVQFARKAHRLIFAHALLESRLHDGESPGRVIARYTFTLEGGERIVVPIRERFEIGVIPVSWGELPFLAVPDQKSSLWNRHQGEWSYAGRQQMEVKQAWPSDYHLWSWENPRSYLAIESVEILPGDEGGEVRRFVVAAITLGHADEEPFSRDAAIPLKITLPDSADAAPPFTLEVEVDRGVASYTYPLPQGTAQEFLDHSHKGWGEANNECNSPACTEVAASPSATVQVKKDSALLGSVSWGELQATGTIETERVHFEVVSTGRNWVHTTILDDDTGKPIPCRVHFRSPEGIPYAPHGHHAHIHSNNPSMNFDVGGDVRLGQAHYAYIDGKCQGWLPRGDVIVDVARGYEYEPLRTRVAIQPGQRELTLRLKRRHNMNRQRYFSGDPHVHFMSSQGALYEAAGEDVDVVNLLMTQLGHTFTDTEEFTGRPQKSGDGETIVYVSQENRQHLLGHLTLLGLKEPVMPWCSDGPGEAEMGGNLEITMSHWADACHAQGGTVIIPHLPNPNGEPAALIATGRADAVEMIKDHPFFHLEYYRYLNSGYRLPLVGGTDKMDSGVPVGLYRTYAYIPPDQEFNYDNWCAALRSGNTFHSGGPLLQFTVDGQPIGSTITLGKSGGTVEVEARASSIFPIHSLQVVQGGDVVAACEESSPQHELALKTTLKIERSTWLCARCGGPGYSQEAHFDSWKRGIFAHTSPIYLACGEYDVCHADTLHYMLTLIDGCLQHVRRRACQWRPGTVTHHHGHGDHQRFLEIPFQEAIAAIHRKMHEHGIAH